MLRKWLQVGSFVLPMLLVSALDAQEDNSNDYTVDVVDDKPDQQAPSVWRHSLKTERLSWSGGELAELLEESPGVYVRRTGAAGSPTSLTLRGASPVQVLVLLDGLALNPARGGGADLALIPPALIARVDVYRGGGAARFGSGALGGAINLVSAIPTDGLQTTAQAGYGSFHTRRATVGISGGRKELRGLITADLLQADNDFPFLDQQGVEHTRLGADAERLGLVAALIGQPIPALKLHMTGVLTEAVRGSAGPAEFQDRFSNARLDNSARIVSGVIEADLEEAVVSLRPSWRLQNTNYRNATPFLNQGFAIETRHREEGRGGRVAASYYPSWATTSELDGVALHADANVERLGFERTSQHANAHTQNTLTRRSNAAGIVVEAFIFEDSASFVGAARTEQIADPETDWTQVSPAFGFRLTPTFVEGLLVQGNIAKAWRAPSLDELYLDTESVQGDPGLRPEEAISSDLGFRLKAADAWEVEWVAYWLDIDELILFLPVSAWVYRAQNIGEATAYGSEFAVHITPLRWLQIRGTHTWTVARFDTPPQDTLPGRPEHRGRIEGALVSEYARGFIAGRGRSKVFLDNFENLSNPGFVTVDMGVELKGFYGFSFSLTGRNLLDQRQTVDALQAPQPGLNIYAQIAFNQRFTQQTPDAKRQNQDSDALDVQDQPRVAVDARARLRR